MRNFITCLAAVLLSVGCSVSGSGDIILTFDVTGQLSDEVVVVYHNKILTSRLDAQGHSELVITGEDAVYARLFYASDLSVFKQIYLEKGDRVSVKFDGKDFDGTFSFDGDKAEAVKYLNSVHLTALPDEDYALPFDQYLTKIEAKERDAVKLMKAHGLRDAGDFEEMEKGRIKYSYGTQILMYPLGHRYMAQDADFVPDEAYYSVLDSYLIENAKWAALDQYRDFIVEAAHILDEQNRSVTETYPKAVAQMKFIADRFTDEKVRNTLLHYLAYAYIDNFGVKDITDMENIYRTYVKDTVLMAEYDKVCEKWNLTSVGKPSPDFEAVDIDGKVHTLADFRGKYLYIDVWATWCGPCRQELPHLKALEEKYKDACITFLSLSVDREKDKWEKRVSEGGLAGNQLYLGSGSPFQTAYQISGIPRFILLDKEGRIIDNDAQRPSDKYLSDTIDALDGIR